MKYNFTDETRRVLGAAREEAVRLNHDYVGTEHILLGLVRSPGGVAAEALKLLGVDAEVVRQRVNEVVRKGKATIALGELPYTNRAKKVLELTMAEARRLGHNYVGTEHVLLALIAEKRSIAAVVLQSLGVSLERARKTVLEVLGGSSAELEVLGGVPTEFRIEIDDRSEVSIYEQIVARVQEAVATGMRKPGQRLPPVRRLADKLDIAPGTVARAYAELERLGVVVTEGARGTRVAERRAPRQAGPPQPDTLVGLLRPVVVAAFHMHASGADVRGALDEAMKGIY